MTHIINRYSMVITHLIIKSYPMVIAHRAERERGDSELFYPMIKILGSCLFLQSVPANLHANRLHIKQ